MSCARERILIQTEVMGEADRRLAGTCIPRNRCKIRRSVACATWKNRAKNRAESCQRPAVRNCRRRGNQLAVRPPSMCRHRPAEPITACLSYWKTAGGSLIESNVTLIGEEFRRICRWPKRHSAARGVWRRRCRRAAMKFCVVPIRIGSGSSRPVNARSSMNDGAGVQITKAGETKGEEERRDAELLYRKQ